MASKKVFYSFYKDPSDLLGVGGLLLVIGGVFFLSKKILIPCLNKLLKNHPGRWTHALERAEIISMIPHITAPLLSLFILNHFLIYSPLHHFVIQGILAYLTIALTLCLQRGVTFIESLIKPADEAYMVSLHSSAQFLSLLIILGGIGVAVCLLLNVSPLAFLGSLGAATAVLTIVFKDTLTSFMTTIQVSVNRLIKTGDRINIESLKIEGAVEDINLNFIKIKNADTTITILPTFKLFEAPFKIWSAYTHAEIRHLQAPIFIDQESIVLLDERAKELYKKDPLITQYIKDPSIYETNSHLFRDYLEKRLKKHPGIYKEQTITLKSLNPTPQGAPLEIWAFTKKSSWEEHEHVKSEVVETMIALLPVFGLRIHQSS